MAWELELHYLSLYVRARRQGREIDLVQLRPVKTTMEVPTSANGGREHLPCCVDGLPYFHKITTSRDFAYQNRGESFRAELLVYTEEVHFRAPDGLRSYSQGDGNAGNEGDELSRRGRADTDVPFFAPARCLKSPIVSQPQDGY